jgi:hypothetical protein
MLLSPFNLTPGLVVDRDWVVTHVTRDEATETLVATLLRHTDDTLPAVQARLVRYHYTDAPIQIWGVCVQPEEMDDTDFGYHFSAELYELTADEVETIEGLRRGTAKVYGR